jgi:L-lysine 6-transaminase
MFTHRSVQPADVHTTLRRHMVVDGYPIVVDLERSHGSWVRDAVSGREYLDFFSFFASNPIGFSHPGMQDEDTRARLVRAATTKVSNSDYYSTYLAEFVDTLERSAARPEFPYYFFVDGGSLAVENAMKVAFDWKVQKNLERGLGERGTQILHLTHAFHGRSGYSLSVTNTDPAKTRYFPKFDWPRIPSPAARFPLEGANLAATIQAEREALAAAERFFDERPHEIAAILVEPIQGEGGDHHFRAEFFRELRRLSDERESLLIYDEVQTGIGLTGRWWAYEHFGVVPDIVCFAKKLQVGGILVSRRIDEVATHVFRIPSRISSTWGGSLVDMVRATRILEIIENEALVENAAQRGAELLAGLERIGAALPDVVSNPRGRGLMCAIDLPTKEQRNRVVRQCYEDGMIVLPSGERAVRFRPTLTVDASVIAEGLTRLEAAIKKTPA